MTPAVHMNRPEDNITTGGRHQLCISEQMQMALPGDEQEVAETTINHRNGFLWHGLLQPSLSQRGVPYSTKEHRQSGGIRAIK